MDFCEFEGSLVFRVSSRTGSRVTQRNHVLKNKTKQKKRKGKEKKREKTLLVHKDSVLRLFSFYHCTRNLVLNVATVPRSFPC